jgi:hypothetical protein
MKARSRRADRVLDLDPGARLARLRLRPDAAMGTLDGGRLMSDEITMTHCSQCHAPILDPSESWPDDGGGCLCQDCWEAYSSRLWWEMLRQLPGLVGED